MRGLEIKNLTVEVAGKKVVDGLSLSVPVGQVHAIMGPNGTGKSSLSKAIAGHPEYPITGGEVLLDGENIVGLPPDEIARKGFFLAFQYPVEIPGVSIANFIRACLSARLPEGQTLNPVEYYKNLHAKMDELKMDRSFTTRSVNDGFSGGEKKRCDILQMLMLNPKFAILDETDSGLDIDALKIVSEGVNSARSSDRGMLLITHYHRLLEYIKPDAVHVMSGGKIVLSGGPELAVELEQKNERRTHSPRRAQSRQELRRFPLCRGLRIQCGGWAQRRCCKVHLKS